VTTIKPGIKSGREMNASLLKICFVALTSCIVWSFFPIGISYAQDDETALLKEESPRDTLKRQVEALSIQLDADRADDRDAAELALLELGDQAIEFLPPISEDASSEWIIRAERLRKLIIDRSMIDVNQPSLVTLQGTMTGREALSQIGIATGNPIGLMRMEALEKTVVLNFEKTPYWQAIDDVLNQLELVLELEDSPQLQFLPKSPTARQREALPTYFGVFRIEPIDVIKKLDFHEESGNQCSISVALSWEPRLSPSLLTLDVQDLELVCDNGEILKAKPGQETEFIPNGSNLVFDLHFDRPSRAATEIATWQGAMEISIPGQAVSLEFTEIDRASDNRMSVGDLIVVLEKARKNRDVYQILLGVKSVSELDAEGLQSMVSKHEAYLVDDQGKRLEHAGWSTTRISDEGLGFSYLFEIEKELSDYRFVFRCPQSLSRHRLDYALKNIPLP